MPRGPRLVRTASATALAASMFMMRTSFFLEFSLRQTTSAVRQAKRRRRRATGCNRSSEAVEAAAAPAAASLPAAPAMGDRDLPSAPDMPWLLRMHPRAAALGVGAAAERSEPAMPLCSTLLFKLTCRSLLCERQGPRRQPSSLAVKRQSVEEGQAAPAGLVKRKQAAGDHNCIAGGQARERVVRMLRNKLCWSPGAGPPQSPAPLQRSARLARLCEAPLHTWRSDCKAPSAEQLRTAAASSSPARSHVLTVSSMPFSRKASGEPGRRSEPASSPKGSALLIRFFESEWFDAFIALTCVPGGQEALADAAAAAAAAAAQDLT